MRRASTMIAGALTLALLIHAVPARAIYAQGWRSWYTADRSASANASGASVIRVEGRAGTLRIEGRAGLAEVRARGTARASDRNLLQEIQLVAERRGDAVEVYADIPDHDRSWGDDEWAALDMVLEVPEGATLDVRDSSGDTEIRNVGKLTIRDSSGDLRIEGADALDVDDSSGELRIREARSDVRIRDSSGDIVVDRVRGSVVVERDGSGGIEATDVEGSVRVESDGSGGIDVDRVGGDFVVDRGRASGISYRNVKGEVRVPERRDRERRRRPSDW